MAILALIGPYPPEVQGLLESALPSDFEVRHIETHDAFEYAADAEFAVLRTLKLDEVAIRRFPRLRLIQRWGVGYDSVDIEAAGRLGVPVAIAHGVNAVPVAELAVLMILAAVRNLVGAHNHLRSGGWDRQRCIDRSYGLFGKTVGLVGCGSIGREVALRLKPFGVVLRYYDINRLTTEEESDLSLIFMGLDELLATADVVSLHLPLTPDTTNLIDRRRIALLKPSAVLINTSRGGLVDENALADALASGALHAAGLDSFAQEPLDQSSPLRLAENAVLTPHIGGNTRDSSAEMVRKCAANITKIHRGEALSPPDLVNGSFLNANTSSQVQGAT